MEYLDLCCMREVGYTSTKLHFANSLVRKLMSVHVRDAFRISAWLLFSGLCFQVRNSRHSLFFCRQLSNNVALLWAPLSELPVFIVRPHALNREVRTVTVWYEYMYRATQNILKYKYLSIYIYIYIYIDRETTYKCDPGPQNQS